MAIGNAYMAYMAYHNYLKTRGTLSLELGIALEGPDEVGKTSLASFMGDYTTDRSWLTNAVYRRAMPDHDWSSYRDKPVPERDSRHLVILLPEQPTPKWLLRQVSEEHGYLREDYQRVVDLYAGLPWLAPDLFVPWATVSMLCWATDAGGNRYLEPSPLYKSSPKAGSAASIVVAASQVLRYRLVAPEAR